MSHEAGVPEFEQRCDHICLLDDAHVDRGEPHFYGYEHPSPRVTPGRCPAVLSGIGGVPLNCNLKAGHAGLHHDMDGADWGTSVDKAQPNDLLPLKYRQVKEQ